MPQRVYRFRELKAAGVPFTRKHVTSLEKRGLFPNHFNITEFSVGWVAAEVDAWVESKIRSRSVAPMPPPGARKQANDDDGSHALEQNLRKRVDELELTTRPRNALALAGIIYVGDLVQKSETDLLGIPNIGRASMASIKAALGKIKLRLDMQIVDWPPEGLDPSG
jgi:DNA-directed RNA polymerase alpha subunit